jgi:hypothetical protein
MLSIGYTFRRLFVIFNFKIYGMLESIFNSLLSIYIAFFAFSVALKF